MNNAPQKISAIIITYNEIDSIEQCISSIAFADEIIVVDSYSSDGTFEFLQEHPKVKLIQNPFENYTSQKSFALKQASYNWVLFLDADEVIPQKLKQEIKHTVNSEDSHAAYWCYKKFMFKGQSLHFSGWQTDKNYRLFQKDKVQFHTDKLVHETLNVEGTSGTLKTKLIHYCYKNYEQYEHKIRYYGRLKAIQDFNAQKKFSYTLLMVKPLWKFTYNYLVRLGFLDGKKGITICYLDALGVLERYTELRHVERINKEAFILDLKRQD